MAFRIIFALYTRLSNESNSLTYFCLMTLIECLTKELKKTYNVQIFASFLGILNYLQYTCTKKRRKDKNGQEIRTTFK